MADSLNIIMFKKRVPHHRWRYAAVLTVTAACLGGAPAAAQAGPLDGARPLQPDEPPQMRSESAIRASLTPRAVDYVRRELGTSRSDAEDWLVVQGQVVPQLNLLYRDVGLDRLGPIRFDNDRRKLVVPTIDADAERQVAEWARSGAFDPAIVEHEQADRSVVGIQRAVEALGDALAPYSRKAHANVNVSPRGRITVTVADDAPATVRARLRTITDGANVALVPGQIVQADPVFNCWAHPSRTAGAGRRFCDWLAGGTAVDGLSNGAGNQHCTAGFFVASPGVLEPYLLTAGHCINLGTTAWSYRADAATHLAVGPTLNKMYGPGHGGDAGLIKITNVPTWWAYPGWMNWNPNPPAVPTQSVVSNYAGFNAPVNTIVCKNGQAGGTACGTVTNQLTPLIHTGTSWTMIHMLEITNGCAIGGDSGAPVTMASVETAVGIVSASQCGTGSGPQIWYAEPVHRALSTTGTLMMTASGPM